MRREAGRDTNTSSWRMWLTTVTWSHTRDPLDATIHARRAMSVRFDDPNLVSSAGLVPIMARGPMRVADLLTGRLPGSRPRAARTHSEDPLPVRG